MHGRGHLFAWHVVRMACMKILIGFTFITINMKNKTPKKYTVQRTIVLEYEMTALTKKELLDMPRSDYNTFAHTNKIEKSLHVRRKI